VRRAALAAAGVEAEGLVGDADPLLAMDDALRLFPADEIVVATGAVACSSRLVRGLVRRAPGFASGSRCTTSSRGMRRGR
jgi:hypothetical protein